MTPCAARREYVVLTWLFLLCLLQDIVEDIQQECSSHGTVLSIIVPRPGEADASRAVGENFNRSQNIALSVRTVSMILKNIESSSMRFAGLCFELLSQSDPLTGHSGPNGEQPLSREIVDNRKWRECMIGQ